MVTKEKEATSDAIDFSQDKRFFGHPKGLGVTSTVILSQAFGNYGMSAILIYYLYTAVAQGGLGFSQTNAAQFVNVYSSLSFMAGILGGYMADRFLGIRKALGIGYLVKTVGYLLLAIPGGGTALYLASQFLLLVAGMCMGNSLNALAGKMYSKTDERRDSGFSLMYVMNNVGAIAPIVTGTVALMLNYNAGFLVAGIVQGLGWLLYILTANKVFGDAGVQPDDPAEPAHRKATIMKVVGVLVVLVGAFAGLLLSGTITPTMFCNGVSTISIFVPMAYLIYIYTSRKTSREEARRIIPFVFVFVANCFAMMIWNQSTTILAIYAAERVNMNFFGYEMTPAAFQTVPAIYAVLFGLLCSALWNKMGNRQPSTPLKFGIGTAFWAFGPLFMVIPFLLYPSNVRVSPMWLMIFYALIIWGEAMTSPVGMSAATKVAPTAFTAQMVTVWQLSQSTGSGLSALAANFYVEGSETGYFLFIGGITLLVGLVLWIGNKRLGRMME